MFQHSTAAQNSDPRAVDVTPRNERALGPEDQKSFFQVIPACLNEPRINSYRSQDRACDYPIPTKLRTSSLHFKVCAIRPNAVYHALKQKLPARNYGFAAEIRFTVDLFVGQDANHDTAEFITRKATPYARGSSNFRESR